MGHLSSQHFFAASIGKGWGCVKKKDAKKKLTGQKKILDNFFLML
jgi:hypothetical protein